MTGLLRKILFQMYSFLHPSTKSRDRNGIAPTYRYTVLEQTDLAIPCDCTLEQKLTLPGDCTLEQIDLILPGDCTLEQKSTFPGNWVSEQNLKLPGDCTLEQIDLSTPDDSMLEQINLTLSGGLCRRSKLYTLRPSMSW